jgi:lysophospholipase L1-like esterase
VRKLVAFGDSITYGEFVPTEYVWPTLLRERMPEWRILNRGVCGDTTRLGLERFPRDVQFERPHTVVIQFGLNDANKWETDNGLPRVSLSAFQANLNEMILRAKAADAERIVLCTLTRPWAWLHQLRKDAALYSAAVRALPRSWERVEVFDAERLCPDDDKHRHVDGLHLSQHGHAEYARLIGDLLCAG